MGKIQVKIEDKEYWLDCNAKSLYFQYNQLLQIVLSYYLINNTHKQAYLLYFSF